RVASTDNITFSDDAGNTLPKGATITSGSINVSDIVARKPGQVFFDFGPGADAQAPGAPLGTWEFRDGYDQILIVNDPDLPVVVHDIRPYDAPADRLSSEPLVRLSAADDSQIPLMFNIRRTTPSSLVEIDSTSAASGANVVIAGTIDNPIGTTIVHANGGSI